MGAEINRKETRGRPPKGIEPMTSQRKVRLDPETDYLLVQKCRRLGCTVAEGIREAIIRFVRDRH